MTGFDSKRQASKSLAANPWREAIDAELVCLHLGTVDSFHSANEALDALINWHIATALDPEVSSAAQALVDRGAAQAAPEPVAWYRPSPDGDDSIFRDHRTVVACTGNKWEGFLPLYAAAPPAAPADPWKAAIDDELVCCHIGTTDSFPDAKAALKNLIDWNVQIALDPAVSSDAQALIEKGKSATPAVPLTDEMVEAEFVSRGDDKGQGLHPYWKDAFREGFNFARSQLSAAPAAPVPLTDDQIDEIWDGSFDSADPKRQLSFRQTITRAIEQAHGIGIKGKDHAE